jgi:hypothetical protein
MLIIKLLFLKLLQDSRTKLTLTKLRACSPRRPTEWVGPHPGYTGFGKSDESSEAIEDC